MNTMTRRCCPGCGAPAPLALGQDWCRYCREFIGVSKDMATAVRSPSDIKLFVAALWALEAKEEEEEPVAAPIDYGYGHCTETSSEVVTRNLMKDPAFRARVAAAEAAEETEQQAMQNYREPTDWVALFGKLAVNALCAVIFAAPLTFVLWAVAVSVMGQ